MLNPILSRAGRPLLVLLFAGACGRQAQVSSPAASTTPAPARTSIAITDGESLIRAMHAKYDGRWYRTMTMIQRTTIFNQTGAPLDQSWYQAMSLPGRFRIDYGNPDLGNGLLFTGDSSFQFSGGRLARASVGWNELLLLGNDVYTQSPEMTVSVLRSLGYQMSRLRGASFDGRSVWVVGSASITDTTSKQFWIDRDRLVLVRTREKRPEGRHVDIRFGQFIQAGNAWIPKQVYQLIDGQTRLHQELSNIKPDVTLDPALFDPKQYNTVKHWSKP